MSSHSSRSKAAIVSHLKTLSAEDDTDRIRGTSLLPSDKSSNRANGIYGRVNAMFMVVLP